MITKQPQLNTEVLTYLKEHDNKISVIKLSKMLNKSTSFCYHHFNDIILKKTYL